MPAILKSPLFLISATIVVCIVAYMSFFIQDPIDYNAEVKPIINKKCISCHGGVKKKAGFSLLFQEEALAATASGKPAIIPGDAKNSEMIKRLNYTDLEERMPYHKEPLTDEEKEILTKWVDQGAKFSTHWAYEPIKKPNAPSNGFFSFLGLGKTDEIDAFVDEKLEEVGLSRSDEADKKTLLRRVSLDLIGMPAPKKIADKYLSDASDQAYENLVNELLALSSYGEKWAGMWMDISRYADTKGYERDDARSIWRYRDWLINAFNNDKPYDQFITEQLAGDLLPNATDEQFIATAFHRNTMTNDEGGTDNEEFRTAAILDRVNTTWETLMGTSFACVQCHSHPYDPFKHEEYYKFMAYFNNSRDEDTNADYPLLREFKNSSIGKFDSVMSWVKTFSSVEEQKYYHRLLKTGQPAINSLLADSMVNAALADTKFLSLRKTSWARIKGIPLTNKSNMLLRYRSGNDKGILSISLNNPNEKPFMVIPIPKTENGWGLHEIKIPTTVGKHDLYLHYENQSLKSKDDNGMTFDWIALTPDFPGKSDLSYNKYHNLFIDLLNKPDAEFTPVMMDNPDDMYRKTKIFERGNWLLKTSEVTADYPAIFKIPNEKFKNNRLGLAKWMTSKNNPLTSRTMINRLWEQLFGQGLVETLEDLGSQGALPSHRELLDYLSYEFMNEYDWSVKKMLKRMVTSETYKQSSYVKKESLEKDALNRFYSHAPRIRLSAEQIRDQALSICGVISNKMYGPSVMPFQPDGIWASPYDGRKWVQSIGEEQYRRGLYTYWKRSSPYPSMVNFDGSAREVCMSRRIKTNTPLQALTLLNDSTYWDLSVKFAERLMKKKNNDLPTQIREGYALATGQEISESKLDVLKMLYHETLSKLSVGDMDLKKILSDTTANKNSAPLASLAVVTNTILNLDEVITKN